MQNDRVLSMFSLAQKAGAIASGEYSVENAVKSGKVFLLVVAVDASDNTKKKMRNMATYYEVPIVFYGDKNNLGHSLGKEYRAMMAVLDQGFSDAIQEKLQNN